MPRNIPEERKLRPEGSLPFSKQAEPDTYSSILFVCLDKSSSKSHYKVKKKANEMSSEFLRLWNAINSPSRSIFK